MSHKFFNLLCLAAMLLTTELSAGWQWAKSAGGNKWDLGRSIALDATGNQYITGEFYTTATFGATNLTSVGGSDIFITKLDDAGNFVWARQAGSTSTDVGWAIAVDAAGNQYVTGYFSETATFGGITLYNNGTYNQANIFIAKLSPDGNFLWAKQAGNVFADDYGYGIAVDGNGNCYITGQIQPFANFGQIPLIGQGNIFIAKMDTDGNFIWATQCGNVNGGRGHKIKVDPLGNLYLTGEFQSTGTFGNTNLTSVGSADAFVAKMNPAGEFIWAKNAGGQFADQAYDLGLDANGNIYFTGNFQGTAAFGTTNLIAADQDDIFISKLDNNGNFIWSKSFGSYDDDCGNAISVTANGTSFVTGYFTGTVAFGTTNLTTAGYKDVFVTKLNSAGTVMAAKRAGGQYNDNGMSIAANGSDEAMVTGFFVSSADFGTATLVSAGDDDIFIAKITEDGSAINDLSSSKNLQLAQNYPNPFNNSTQISFQLAKADLVTLTITNLQGQVVEQLANSSYPEGVHTVSFNAANTASGIYLYTLKTSEQTISKRMLLVK